MKVFRSTVLHLEPCNFSLSCSNCKRLQNLYMNWPAAGRPRANFTRASNYPAGVDMWQPALACIYLLKHLPLFKYTYGHLYTRGWDGHGMRCGLICCFLEAKKLTSVVSQSCSIVQFKELIIHIAWRTYIGAFKADLDWEALCFKQRSVCWWTGSTPLVLLICSWVC